MLNSKSIIGVIGGGAMGSGIAQVAASFGHTVHIYDTNNDVVLKAKQSLVTVLTKLVEKQKDGTMKRVYRTKTYLCKLTKDGFLANDILYKQTSIKDNLISEYPQPFLRRN